MNLSSAERALADAVRTARANRTTIASRGGDWGLDLAAAYRIQAALTADRPLAGYKLGLISPAKQRQMGITTPLYGRIAPHHLLDGVVRLDAFIQPRIEPELALILADDVAPAATPGQAARAIGGIFLGVDILDSVWAGYTFGAAEVTADNTSGGAFLLGERMLALNELAGELRLTIDGRLIGAGAVADLGDIPGRLNWLAEAVGGLRAGQTIFLGSPAAAQPAQPGVLELSGPSGTLLTAWITQGDNT